MSKKDIYIFDFDDTLMWAPRWYEEVEINEHLHVLEVKNSPFLWSAHNFASKARKGLPLRFQEMKLKLNFLERPSQRNWYFLLLDTKNNPLPYDCLFDYFSESELKKSRLERSDDGLEAASVLNDDLYYRNLETAGNCGINEKVAEIFQKNRENAVVLTARLDQSRMKDKIHQVLSENIGAPRELYLRPREEMSCAEYKGEVVIKIASRDDVNLVYFYDDDISYIDGVSKAVNKSKLNDRVIIYQVCTKHKPASKFHHLIGEKL